MIEGTIDDPRLSELSEHLEHCTACQTNVRNISADDTLVQSLRSDPEAASRITGKTPPSLVEKVKQIAQELADSYSEQKFDSTSGDVASEEGGALTFLAPGQSADEIGRLGGYRVLKVLGKGGMGVVFLAEDIDLDRKVALKVMLPKIAANPSANQRFLREARAAARLKCDHIVTIYQIGEDRGVPFLAMELLEGEPLDQVLRSGKQIGFEKIIQIGLDVARGLATAHEKGLVHRDIKPGNLWLEASKGRVKILDFGLARQQQNNEGHLTASGAILGTPAYMSPEQARGDKIDARTDLFSLGGVLYHLVTGRQPFQGSNIMALLTALAVTEPIPIQQLNPSAPHELARLIHKLLSKDMSARFFSAAEVVAALNQLGSVGPPVDPNETPVSANIEASALTTSAPALSPETIAFIPRGPSKRRRMLAGGLLVLMAGLSGIAYWITRPEGHRSSDQGPKLPNAGGPRAENPGTVPRPLDALERNNISPGLLALAGNGDPLMAPPELVAVLGDYPFAFNGVRAGAIRPDGEVLATAVSGASWVMFWDVKTGKPIGAPLLAASKQVIALAYSADGKKLAISSMDQTVAVWDAEARTKLRTYHFESMIGLLEFSRDGNWLAAAWTKSARDPHEGWVTIWDAHTLDEARRFPATTPGVGADMGGLAFSSDCTQLAVGTITGEMRIWDPGTGKPIGESRRVAGGVYSLTAGSDSGKFAIGGVNVVSIPETQKPARLTTSTGMVFTTACTRDGSQVAWAGESGQVQVRTQKTKKVRSVLNCNGEVRFLAFTPDGKKLITGGTEDPRPPRLWDLETEQELDLFQLPKGGGDPVRAGHNDRVTSLAFNRAQTLLYSGSDDGTIKIWNLATRAPLHTLTPGPIVAMDLSPDGSTLAVAAKSKYVKLLDSTTGMEKARLNGNGDVVLCVAFSPTGRMLASGCRDGTVRLSPLDSDGAERVLTGFADAVTCVAFSSDGTVLAAGCRDGAVRRWRTADEDELAILRNPAKSPIRSLAFRPDGKTLVTGDEGYRINEWDLTQHQVRQGAARHQLGEFAAGVLKLAWSQDGRMLASCAWDGTARLWDWTATTPRARVFAVPKGLEYQPLCFTLTHDDRYLAVGTGELIEIFRVSDAPP
jgi:WD40 repeat protein/serine/threonine protein kinase